ncbi:MAG: GtrA family protein [Ottowia sp.]|uniref:GtrA family protein n=1 Tax=Ottowia sp. TaxID=1898956 RepID=UPI0039E25B94
MRIALLYALFCAAAIVINIGAQDLTLRLWPSAIAFSIIVGTAAGLVVKYILDKRFIFRFTAQNAAHDGKTFMLYTLMGVATTAIFWGFEYGAWMIFETTQMRYLGGVLGLVMGYLAKYHLDKKFVFSTASSPP